MKNIISSVTLTKVWVILRLLPPPNTYRTRCTHDMFWIKKNKMCTRSTKQLHLAVIEGSFCLKMVAAYIVRPCSTDISWWKQLHLDIINRSCWKVVVHAKVGRILRLFPPPNTYRIRCMHDMLWIKKRRIFHSLNEATTSICYQTHIGSEDGEHLLRIFHLFHE